MSWKGSKIMILLWGIALNAIFFCAGDATYSVSSGVQAGVSPGSEKSLMIAADPAPHEKKIPSRYNKRFFSESFLSTAYSFIEFHQPDFQAMLISAQQRFTFFSSIEKDSIRGPPSIA